MKNKFECQRKHCRSCPQVERCDVRATEWLKGTDIILSKNRRPGEGQRMAKELIDFMKIEFYGGVDLEVYRKKNELVAARF